jgi:poly-gamma-glutamate synthesis protein (capsule biosynthesis protein)
VTETDEDGNTIEKTVQSGSTRINAPASFLDAALDCGFDVLTNANNHIYDRGTDGIVKTLEELDTRGVPHTGAYAAEGDKVPLIVDVEGIHIAIFAYTDILNNSPGSSNTYMIDRYSEELVAADMAAAEEAGADYTIVCIHWGIENTHSENSAQRRMAEFIANAGADIILGSHPHATQPVALIATERGEDVPVVYSMGNFISSMPRTMNKDSVIMRLALEKEHETGTTSLTGLSYIPTLCTSTSGGGFAALTADLASIEASSSPSQLSKSRARTIDVLGDTIAIPE